MPVSFEGKLVVAISSRALFDFEEENRVFESEGERAYIGLHVRRGKQAPCRWEECTCWSCHQPRVRQSPTHES